MQKQANQPSAKKAPRKKAGSKKATDSKKRRTVIAAVSVAGVLIAAIVIFFLPLISGEAHADTVIRIPRGATAEMVKDSVARYLGPDYAKGVMKAAKLQGADFSTRHGAYTIPEGVSPLKASRILTKGAQTPLTITINGFRGVSTLAERLARRLDFSQEEFVATATDPAVTTPYGLTPGQLLSLFIDDSYEVYWTSTPKDIIDKVGQHYNAVWNETRRKKAEQLGLTPAEIMTICSIVDEETNKADEKGTVGRLYINRLKTGMKLQADPTVKYAVGDFSLRRILSKHLSVESPYNTYKVKGLPPGPIRTTSVATIDSVLDSAPHDYLYMCAKEDFSGYHNFAASYEEHLANARRYQKALDERGIK